MINAKGLAPRLARRITLAFLAAAVMSVVLIAAPAAIADPADDQALEQQMETVREEMEGATQAAQDAAVALAQANALLPQAQQMLADAQAAYADAQAKAAPALAKLNDLQTKVAAIAVKVYEGGDVASLNAMLTASSPDDFINGLTFLQFVSVGQGETIAQFKAANADVLDAYAQAKAAQDQATAAQSQLDALIAQRQQALDTAQQEKSTTLAQWQQMEDENETIANEVRVLVSGGGPLANPGSKFIMPLFGAHKSSDFGYRYDPVYLVYQLHAGVDLAAPAGTEIHAGAAGDVYQAGWDGGYGNYTCIYHGQFPAGSGTYHDPTLNKDYALDGQGLSTCYAHQSAILVSVGQHVDQGQVIGEVGTTGASTGNHLHFEVRIGGNPVQPLPWLPECLC